MHRIFCLTGVLFLCVTLNGLILSTAGAAMIAVSINSLVTDTDGDGYSDADEIAAGTNPNDKNDNVLTFVIANSIPEFSGVQGQDDWFNGYRNFTVDGGAQNYDPKQNFIPYAGGEGMGTWNGVSQQWTGAEWDLNTEDAGPWTYQNAQNIHPNGTNSPPNEEHWPIRRWIASKLTQVTPVAIIWQVKKDNLNGDGVTGAVFVNGKLIDSIAIDGNNGTNPVRTVYVNLNTDDIVDLALTPQGLTDRGDGADGSITWFRVDTRIPPNPQQPDGTPFVPARPPPRFEDITFDSAQNKITVAWTSSPDGKYTLEASGDLKTWTVVKADIPGTGNRTTYSEDIDPAQPARFYRLWQ